MRHIKIKQAIIVQDKREKTISRAHPTTRKHGQANKEGNHRGQLVQDQVQIIIIDGRLTTGIRRLWEGRRRSSCEKIMLDSG